MFEQHERWLEELLEYTNRKESLTCISGHMPTAIAQEIATACADNRQHSRQQIPNWQSMASNLSGWPAGVEVEQVVARRSGKCVCPGS